MSRWLRDSICISTRRPKQAVQSPHNARDIITEGRSLRADRRSLLQSTALRLPVLEIACIRLNAAEHRVCS